MKHRTLGLLAAALLAAFLFVPRQAPASAPRSIVLVTIDTLRAGSPGQLRLPATQLAVPRSPGARRLVFENAVLRGPDPGRPRLDLHRALPSQHGVRSNGQGLATVLATSRSRGAPEGGLRDGSLLRRRLPGADGGFQRRTLRRSAARASTVRRTRSNRARGFRPAPGARAFVWIHLTNPTCPSGPAGGARRASRPDGRGQGRVAGGIAAKHASRRISRDARRAGRELAAYDAEIRFADRELERLFDAMTRS